MLKRLKNPRTVRSILIATAAVLLLQPLSAQSMAAKLELMSGQVSILGDSQTLSSAKPLFVGNPIQPKAVVITGPNSYAKFHLEDGSYFEVFENSKVQFKEDYPGWAHLLNVIIGKIHVFIEHTKGPNPNSVTTPTAVISVRGTEFDVVVEDDDGTTFVSVDEGLVQVRGTTAVGFEPLLTKGQSVRVFRNQGLLGKQVDKNGVLQKIYRAGNDLLRVWAQQHPGGIAVGGTPGGAGGPVAAGAPTGAQGDKGKGGTAPGAPPAPPAASTGH
jgi:hypothetical protein